ncbi:cytochrome P450 monooxygenase [Delitschia confertaspora ATCC 74209]|uniref:Cytochrome P450 monooxygenase n=1 Tax=Delitschia confertaspora ATCC 74209 TaxID=1513339 RepID=A0A9P4JFQ6_9PLEO|nr:cytochrome P450 monooxygenase [Delitschia confertaspora ATCC 74209]
MIASKILFHNSTILFCICTLFFALFYSSIKNRRRVKAPFVGYRTWFEPTFLVRLRFVKNAREILTSGYEKYKDGIFIVRRNDADILVLSNKYLDEIRLLPNTVLSSVASQVNNLVGKYTYASIMLESNLHTRVLQSQLTPNLGVYISKATVELEHSLKNDVPSSEGWIEVNIQSIVQTMVSRMSGAAFLGYPACRNQEWLKLSVKFSIDIFRTSFTLRMFPRFMHPLLAIVIPSRYRIRQHIREAEKIIAPLILEHREKQTLGAVAKSSSPEDVTLLTWMLDNATGTEADPTEMANRQLILTLASIHTTSLAVTHTLYDLCAHPEYFDPLREEIRNVFKDLDEKDLLRDCIPQLQKLESFIMESQRFNPPILMTPQRTAMRDITLRDGTFIPVGQAISFPSANIAMDPLVIPNPEIFDPFRSYYKRKQPGQERRHLMVLTDKNNLAFGHGKQACPGRHFAVAEIKTILARFLMDYEFKYPPGKGRPRNFFVDDNIFPDPSARLMIRRRV